MSASPRPRSLAGACAVLAALTLGGAPTALGQQFCPSITASASIDGCSTSPPGFDSGCWSGASSQSVTVDENCYLVTYASKEGGCSADRYDLPFLDAPAYFAEARLRVASPDPACAPDEIDCWFALLYVGDGERGPRVVLGTVPLSVGPGYGIGVYHSGGEWWDSDWYVLDVTQWHTYRVEVERGTGGQVRYLVDGALVASFPYDELPLTDEDAGVYLSSMAGTVWLDSAAFDVCAEAPGPRVEPTAATFSAAVPAIVTITGAPGNAHDWVGIYAPGVADGAPAMWKYTNGATDGSLGFLGLPVATGYQARLFVNDSLTKIATSTQTFAVTAADATVEPAATSYSAAVPAVITFTGAPGNAHDWVGIYAPGVADGSPAMWRYTNGAASGSLSFLGLAVGTGYEARLFVNDTLTKIATSTQGFAVTAAIATVEPAATSYSRAVPAVIAFTGAPGNAHDWVAIYAPGAADGAPAMWKYTNGAASGSLSFLGLAVGTGYEARLFVNDSLTKIATSTQTFDVMAANATVEPAAAIYTRAYPAVVNFTGAPGNAHDWVGIYVWGAADGVPTQWKYTNAAIEGSLSFLGLPPASGYEARLFVNDSLTKIATSTQTFTVTTANATVEPAATSYTRAYPVIISFAGAPGNAHDWVGIYAPGVADGAPAMWRYTNGATSGSLTFLGLDVGTTYEARLFVNDSLTRIATSTQTFVVTAADATVQPTAASYTRAYPALITFTGAPGNAHDWVGIYAPGVADGAPAMWRYTNGDTEGSLSFLGLAVGTGYQARLFVNDSLTRIATSTQVFDVTGWSGTLAASSARYAPGDTVVITFTYAPGNAHDWVGVYAAGAGDEAPLQWRYTNGLHDGSLSFAGLAAGGYDARLFVNDALVRLGTSSGFAIQGACIPTTCAGSDCGVVPDGCGGILKCPCNLHPSCGG
jgi:hypothetical protein